MSHALVVMSGGLDSTVALAVAKEREGQVSGISFHYNQRHHAELDAAKKIAHHYEIPHGVVHVDLGMGGVLMHHEAEMPHETYEALQTAEGPSPTYVPYRNGTFLSLAASYALASDCDTLYAGMHAEDAHNWAYPDCTPEFLGAMQNAIYIGTYHQVRLVAPFTYKTKTEIISLGRALKAPLHLTMSCYEGTRPACGKCPTCVARLEAFRSLTLNDPLDYEFDMYRDGVTF